MLVDKGFKKKYFIQNYPYFIVGIFENKCFLLKILEEKKIISR
jgi:hypothetical protein